MEKNARQGSRRKRGPKGRKKGRGIDSELAMAAGKDSIYTSTPGLLIPNQSVSKMHFWAMSTFTNNTLSYTNVRYAPNSAYDVDPLVGSAAVPGLTEMAAFYSGMRVVRYNYAVELSNQEAFPVTVYCLPILLAGTDPTANTITGLDYPMNPYAKTFQLSAKGGQDRCKFRGSVDLPTLYGKVILTDDGYASSTAAAVAAGFRIYFVVGACSGSNNFTTAGGVTHSSHFFMETLFYGRKELTT